MSDTTILQNSTHVIKPKKSVALSGVPAGNTALCTVGKSGNDLHYRGYDILDLAKHCEFEEVAHLLIHGKLPTRDELAAYKTKLKALRGLPANVRTVLEALPAASHPMDVMRTGVSALGCTLPEKEGHTVSGARDIADKLLAWVDGQSLRTYRHAPNTGTRKSWAAGDATSRAVRLALMAKTGEMGYPSALTAPVWGFYDVSFKGESFRFQRPYGSYVMENVLFKISFPAEFHSQTAVEAAMTLYEQMQAAGKTAADIEKVTIRTHEACIRIIDKKGPLNNPADRDHCIQYMVAIPLLFGRLTAADYEDNVAQDKRIDALREKINCFEDPAFTADYHDPEKRAIANAITLEFTDDTRFEEVVVEYPIGHACRRQDGIPKLVDKFKINLARQFPTRQQQRILEVSLDRARLEQMPVNEYLDLYVI